MARLIQLTLDDLDVGQIIDGLEARAASWRNTYRYLATGESPAPFFVAEECNDADEARKLAEHYERLIVEITNQAKAQ